MAVAPASRTPRLEEVLSRVMQYRLEDVHTAMPAKVLTYDAVKQRADVVPLVRRIVVDLDGNEAAEELPVIPGVPVAWPRAGGFFMTLPLQVEDFVLLVFAERSIDRWLDSTGTADNPIDLRTHDLSDAIAIPCLYPFSKALQQSDAGTENMVLGKEGGSPQIHIGGGQVNLYEKSAADFVALAAKVKKELDTLKSELNALITVFNAHTHLVKALPDPAPGPPAVPTLIPAALAVPAAPALPVAASKVKAT